MNETQQKLIDRGLKSANERNRMSQTQKLTVNTKVTKNQKSSLRQRFDALMKQRD